jgi:hypothetical protein
MAIRLGIAASVLTLGFCLPAHAADPDLRLPMTWSASQDPSSAWHAVDGVDGTAWCARGGESLTLTFATPVPLDQLEVRAGLWKSGEGNEGLARDVPKDVQIVSDTGEILVVHPGRSGHVLVAWTGDAPRTLVIKPGPMPAGKLACLDGVVAWREGVALRMLPGVDDAALARLPADLKTLQGALQGCDKEALGKVVRLPLLVAGQKVTSVAQAQGLCKAGRLAVAAFEAEDVALASQPVAPGMVSVKLPTGTWRLAWRSGAWKLAGVQAGREGAKR